MSAIPTGNFAQSFAEKAQDFPQGKLTASSWELESDALRTLRDKIVSGKKTLKEVYGSPYRGVLTGLNEAFVIDRATRDRLIAEDPKSEEIIKPVVKGNELRRWRVEGRDGYLILMPKGWTKAKTVAADENAAWNWLEKSYPAIAKQLLPFADRGQVRSDQGDYWWELRACDYYDKFEKPKISYIEICNMGEFTLDVTGFYQEATTFMIPNADKFLLGLLNSNVLWYFWVATTTILRGGFQRMKNQFGEPTPIPIANQIEKSSVEKFVDLCQQIAWRRLESQSNFTRRIPDLCPADREAKLSTKLHDWWQLSDFAAFRAEVKKCFKAEIPLSERNAWEDLFTTSKAEITKLSAQIKRNEDEINAIVYKLFDLNPDEIKLLEESIGIK